MNRWSDAEKAAYLAISLRGPAATVLTNLPPEQHRSYEALTTALDTRFGLSHQTELNRMRLKARTRRRDESLAELAEDVEHLVRLHQCVTTSPFSWTAEAENAFIRLKYKVGSDRGSCLGLP